MQDLGGDRVEEGLGQLGLLVVDQQPDELELDRLPGGVVDGFGVELLVQALHGFVHPVVVELHPIAHRRELALPVGGLEALLGPPGGLPEDPVVLVEAFDHRLGDGQGDRVFVALRRPCLLLPRACCGVTPAAMCGG